LAANGARANARRAPGAARTQRRVPARGKAAQVSFASMLGGLTKNKVRFVVIGGVAAAVHGSSRVTNDLDICYDAGDRGNVEALATLLAKWKAYPRGVAKNLPFILDERTLRGAPVMTLATT